MKLKKMEKKQKKLQEDLLCNHYMNLMKNKTYQIKLEQIIKKPNKKSNTIHYNDNKSHNNHNSKDVLPFIVEDYRNQVKQTIINNSDHLFVESPNKVSFCPRITEFPAPSPYCFEEKIFSPTRKFQF